MTVFTHALSTNNYGSNSIIVDANPANGTHTTIQGAVTAAAANQTIFIRPGTYTENITLASGKNLAANTCDAFTPNVTIVGTITVTSATTVSISGIRLQTNSAALLAITGSAASNVNLFGCYLNCLNNTGITFSSSGGPTLSIENCDGNLGTTGIALFAHSSTGNLNIRNCGFNNSGGSSTANTCSAGVINITNSTLTNPTTLSGTGATTHEYCHYDTSGQNATCLTLGGSGAQFIRYSQFFSGSASSVSISGTALMDYCMVDSTNTNAVTGAGTLQYGEITFTNTSSLINTTTQTYNYTNVGKYKASGQPAFSAYLASADNDRTGDGTTYTLGTNTAFTEVFDIGGNFNTNGTFTAPVTGKYFFSGKVRMSNLTALATTGFMIFITTTRSYFSNEINCGLVRTIATAADLCGFQHSIIAEMNAGDTCVLTITVSGTTKTIDISGDANMTTFFQGYQIA